ncbi:MAG: KUP/HAK/KT family potassium transporter [Desulfosalsimonadaceae bacterium]|nr:KUP/HAK/KT family potassium transporter [Desulfosalsimonadaceae bacterium]
MKDRTTKIYSIIKSLGLVFGDIGTSPIYTLTVIFLITPHSLENIIGVLSLIVWTLILLVMIQYAWLAMSLGQNGEGGTIVLREILTPLLKSGRQVAFVTFLSFVGISLLIGDGVITPAISILSAVEGMLLIPGLEEIPQNWLILIAAVIAIVLFSFQKKGTDKVSAAFGPLMVIWFSALTLSGLMAIATAPSVLRALNPYYGIHFLMKNGFAGFFVLSEVTLCATGGEALYADMGHLGRAPIVKAWYFVFVALIVNYLGQGAFLIHHSEAKNILFAMIFSQAKFLYIPFLILSIMATVIASQAMISGMFSIVYQGITTRIMPLFKIAYTSTEMQSQVYIGFVNWFLLLSVLFIMVEFRESSHLAAAYGLAVTGTMTITGIMMTWIFWLRRKKRLSLISLTMMLITTGYFLSNTFKIPHGGYWSIVIALIPFGMIILWREGQKKLYQALKPIPLSTFLVGYREIYRKLNKIKGSALFFAKDPTVIPPYIAHTMINNNIIYEDNIIVSIVKLETPFGIKGSIKEEIADGLRVFELQIGYMEITPDVEKILRKAQINEKAIFYGIEDIQTDNFFWVIFVFIKKLTPNIIQFYKLPRNKTHGVVTLVKM